MLGQTSIQDPTTGSPRKKYKNVRDPDFEGQITRIEGILLIRFEEGMFFGNVGQLKERLKRIEVHGDLGVHPGEDPQNASTANASIQPVAPTSSTTSSSTANPNRGAGSSSGNNNTNSEGIREEEEESGWEDQTIQHSPSRAGGPRLFGVVFDMKSVSDIDARYYVLAFPYYLLLTLMILPYLI